MPQGSGEGTHQTDTLAKRLLCGGRLCFRVGKLVYVVCLWFWRTLFWAKMNIVPLVLRNRLKLRTLGLHSTARGIQALRGRSALIASPPADSTTITQSDFRLMTYKLLRLPALPVQSTEPHTGEPRINPLPSIYVTILRALKRKVPGTNHLNEETTCNTTRVIFMC